MTKRHLIVTFNKLWFWMARLNWRNNISSFWRGRKWIDIGVATRGEMNLSRFRDTVFHGRALLQFIRCRIRTRDRVRISHVARASRYIQCSMKYAVLPAVISISMSQSICTLLLGSRSPHRRILNASFANLKPPNSPRMCHRNLSEYNKHHLNLYML